MIRLPMRSSKLREQREKCTVDTAARDAQIARINELQDFIKQQPAHLETFDEALVKRWLERIIVWEDHFTVEVKWCRQDLDLLTTAKNLLEPTVVPAE